MESDGGSGDSAGRLVSSGAASLPGGPANPAVGTAAGGLVLPGDVESVGRYLTAAKADSTRQAYEADFRAWSTWARQRGFTPLPAADAAVAAYLAALSDAGASPRTVARRLSRIGHDHREAGHPSPSEHSGTREVLRGIRRAAVRGGRRPKK